MVMGYQLQEIQGARIYFLPGERQTLGRGEDSQICIDDPTISRAHAIIHVTPGGVWVEDLQSTNGSFVHQRRVLSLTLVNTGDPIQFGGLHFQLGFAEFDSVSTTTAASHLPRASLKNLVRKTVPVPKNQIPSNGKQSEPASEQPSAPAVEVNPPSPHSKQRLLFVWGVLAGMAAGFLLGMVFCRHFH